MVLNFEYAENIKKDYFLTCGKYDGNLRDIFSSFDTV